MTGSDAIAGGGELPLLGRSRELAELTGAFEEARAGRGGLVLLTGDPGIGKTRLARTLGDEARAAGAQVALARGWDGGGAPAYWPWLQVLRALAGERDDDALAAQLGPGARRVAQIAPEIRARLGIAEAGDAAESEQARFALFDAVSVFMRRAAADAPVVVLIDDLHTADLPSLLLLAFLARAIGDSPVLVVTTHHDAGPPRGPEVDGVFGELGRFGRHVHLGGLDAADLRRLIAHRTGAEPPDDLVDRVAALTEGNPHRHRRSRPARAVLHSAAPRAPRAHGGPCRRGRAPHRRGREACVEPAGLDRADPGRRGAVLAAPRAGAPRRARGRRAPVRRQPARDAGMAVRARRALPRRRPRGAGASGARAPRRRRLRRLPARQRLDGRDVAARRAVRGPARRRSRRPGRETASAVRRAERRLARGNLRRPGRALPGAVRRRARRLGRGARAHGGGARGGRAPVVGADARPARPRRGAHPRPPRRAGRRRGGVPATGAGARALGRDRDPGHRRATRARGAARRDRARGEPAAGEPPAAAPAARAGAGAAPPAADGAHDGTAADAALRREGDVWRVEFEGRTRFVKDAKGLRHLALLLDNPGVEFHAVDIVGAAEGTTRRPRARAAADGDGDLQTRRAGDGDAGVLLDPQAKREYRARLEDLRAELEEAESFNDPERAARAREEMDFVARELSSAVGLGGRDRRAGATAERARVNVTRAVKGVIRRIAAEDERLGRELETTVHTGYFCRYEPDPRRPVSWRVDGG